MIPHDILADIDKALADTEKHERIRILFAVESGSRAWGFPSPDSDFDVRFVYAHPVDWYLSITPGRDVIELPLNDVLDINGWDIRKALSLLLKPNPVLLEWLSSPIRYRWDENLCSELIALSRRTSHGTACLSHYSSICAGHWKRHLAGQSSVNLKKYFYVLRPALAMRWIRMRPHEIPPMNLHELIRGTDLDRDVISAIDLLLMQKAKTRESGPGPRVQVLDRLIEQELNAAFTAKKSPPNDALGKDANDLFRRIVKSVEQ